MRPGARAPGTRRAGEGLDARVAVRRGALGLQVDLAVAPGSVLVVVGPNGAGKTTLLEALAGLVALDRGHVRVGGTTWDDPADGVLVRPQRRAVGLVHQDYLLFPHLSALENVAFGIRARGTGRREAERQAAEWLARMDLGELAAARPRALSGGQAQRVALARALATRPELLLLDEPLAALDAVTRGSVRADLQRHLAGHTGPTVLVTHDGVDAMVLGDEIAVVEDGRVVQAGTPAQVARAPRTQFVARLVGLNLYRGTASGHGVALDGGGDIVVAGAGRGSVLLAFAPSAVSLHRHRPEGSARNVWPCVVAGLDRYADVVRVRLEGTPPVLADVTAAAVAELRLRDGEPVWASLKATEVHCYPA